VDILRGQHCVLPPVATFKRLLRRPFIGMGVLADSKSSRHVQCQEMNSWYPASCAWLKIMACFAANLHAAIDTSWLRRSHRHQGATGPLFDADTVLSPLIWDFARSFASSNQFASIYSPVNGLSKSISRSGCVEVMGLPS
jgi:hypothetical protein